MSTTTVCTHSRRSSTYTIHVTTNLYHLLLSTPKIAPVLPTELLLPILSHHIYASFMHLSMKAFAARCLTFASVSTLFLLEVTRLVEPISGQVHEQYAAANLALRRCKSKGEGVKAGEMYKDGLKRLEEEVDRAWEGVVVVAGLRGKLRGLGLAVGVGR
jgi:hypothetical protein